MSSLVGVEQAFLLGPALPVVTGAVFETVGTLTVFVAVLDGGARGVAGILACFSCFARDAVVVRVNLETSHLFFEWFEDVEEAIVSFIEEDVDEDVKSKEFESDIIVTLLKK